MGGYASACMILADFGVLMWYNQGDGLEPKQSGLKRLQLKTASA